MTYYSQERLAATCLNKNVGNTRWGYAAAPKIVQSGLQRGGPHKTHAADADLI